MREIEEYRYNAETNPAAGFATAEEVDMANPAEQADRAKRAFKNSRTKAVRAQEYQ